MAVMTEVLPMTTVPFISILALALLIVSVVLAVIFAQWNQAILWVAWAFALVLIVGPLVGAR